MSELAIDEPHLREWTLAEEVASLGEGDFEFMNLRENRTGVPGVIFLSTEMGAHGPRVKYYLKSGKDQPSASVSIEPEPRLLASSLPQRDLARVATPLLAWVKLNHPRLSEFWREGNGWDVDEVAAFAATLESIAG